MKKLKVKLKALRINAEMSQQEAAEKLGVTEKTLQNWENYVTYPNAVQLVSICNLYGCELDDIFLPDALALS